MEKKAKIKRVEIFPEYSNVTRNVKYARDRNCQMNKHYFTSEQNVNWHIYFSIFYYKTSV